MRDLPSPNYDERPDGPGSVNLLVLHYTGMQTAQAAIDRLRDPQAKVSSHYVVDEDGTVLRLVPEAKRAFHAGISCWRGRHGLNDASIGIEIVNPGHEWGYRPYPPAQMEAVRDLCLGILSRHAIPPRNVVGHSDIAPNRKQDPGELFPWAWLAESGIGFWPPREPRLETAPPEPNRAAEALERIGYPMAFSLDILLTAFQRHYLPECVSGVLDERTMAMLLRVDPESGNDVEKAEILA